MAKERQSDLILFDLSKIFIVLYKETRLNDDDNIKRMKIFDKRKVSGAQNAAATILAEMPWWSPLGTLFCGPGISREKDPWLKSNCTNVQATNNSTSDIWRMSLKIYKVIYVAGIVYQAASECTYFPSLSCADVSKSWYRTVWQKKHSRG